MANAARTAKDTPTALSDSTAVVLVSEGGSTTVQPHVVAKIAGLAVREVDGVHNLVPFGTGQAISSIARAVTGNQMRDLGVSVEVGKVEAAVDVRIVTNYGTSIPLIASAIRENVHRRISEMTGLRVTECNIEVVDLWFDDQDEEPAPTRRVQ